MRFAYADPPYFGCGRRYDHLHEQSRMWDDKDTHIFLVGRLMHDYPDGWAMSCNPKDLRWLLPHCPDKTRVCSWIKTYHQIWWSVSVQYAWEPLILVGGRQEKKRKPMVRDWITGPNTRQTGIPGAKPAYFNHWVLDLLNYQEGDEMDDLFPGSGGMNIAIAERHRCGYVDNAKPQVNTHKSGYLTDLLDSPTLTPSRDDEAPRHEARDGGASC